MANEKLVKVSEDTKKELNQLKQNGRSGRSEGDVIAHLVAYSKKNHVELDDDVNSELAELKSFLGIRNDSNAIKILLNHWQQSPMISKDTFALAKSNRW